MNKTALLATFADYKNDSPEAARKYFRTIYPDIEYDRALDVFVYRDVKFDYFMAGIGMDGLNGKMNGENSYLLVDRDEPRLWLFTHGNLEKRWQEYLKTKESVKPEAEPEAKSLWQRFLNFLEL